MFMADSWYIEDFSNSQPHHSIFVQLCQKKQKKSTAFAFLFSKSVFFYKIGQNLSGLTAYYRVSKYGNPFKIEN